MAVDITALSCCLDDFCNVFADGEAHRLLPSEQTRQRSGQLSRAAMRFIVVLFHLSPDKNKVFYLYGIGGQYRACIDELPHDDRLVCLMPRLFVPLMVLRHGLRPGRGARSRSPSGYGSTFPAMRQCASATRPSTRHCTCRAEARCGASRRAVRALPYRCGPHHPRRGGGYG